VQEDSEGISVGGLADLVVFGGGDEGFDAGEAEVEGAVGGGALKGVLDVVVLERGEAEGAFFFFGWGRCEWGGWGCGYCCGFGRCHDFSRFIEYVI